MQQCHWILHLSLGETGSHHDNADVHGTAGLMKARVLEGRGGQARGSADFHEGKGSVTHVGLDTCTPRAMRQATNYFINIVVLL